MQIELAHFFFPEPPLTLYHYCPADTFMKILESRSLWLTDFSKMNDYAEESWAAKIVYSSHKKLSREEGATPCFCQHYHREYESRRITSRKFLCCFSENGDVLSQWRAYAANGSGFAIGFSTHRLKAIKSIPIPDMPDDRRKFLMKICYDAKKQSEFIEQCLALNKNAEEVESLTTAYHLAFLSIAMKNPGFAEEKEWRIVYSPLDPRLNIHAPRNPIAFRNTSRGIAPYFVHKFDHDAVSEIIIGPTNQTTDEDLDLFLKNNGFDGLNVARANATYRG